VLEPLQIDQALDAATLERIRQEMSAARGDAATVLGLKPEQAVVSSARKATRVVVSEAARAGVLRLLRTYQPRIESYFGRSLGDVEEPQFLRYGPGDGVSSRFGGDGGWPNDRVSGCFRG
jgi:predicted 2-oxoglutarate/Fe(II)-dependent dioxygenase YbiX